MALDPETQIIPPHLTEPGEIRAFLEGYVKNKPAGQGWQDFYLGGAGQTVLEMIAALGGFDAFSAAMSRREQSLDLAVLPSSIREHAFNRGVLEGPTDTLVLRLSLSVTPGQSVTITRGELVGTLGDYELYSLENKSATTSNFTLDVAAGFLHTIERNVEPKKFQRWSFNIEERFIAPELERLTLDGEEIPLRSELNFDEKYGGDFMLRRCVPGQVRVFTGNGILGALNTQGRSLSYTYLAYGEQLEDVKNERPSLIVSNVTLNLVTTIRSPVYGIDSEELRGISMYYPIDGRIAQDRDYDAIIMKYFGGVLHDVYSVNTDPNQQVRMIVDTEYVSATHLPRIRQLVDSKRGSGIQVLYTEVPKTSGVVIDLNLRVTDYTFFLSTRQKIMEYLNRRVLKFMRQTTVIRTQDLAVELTEEFGLRFYAADNTTTTLTAFQFILAFNLQVNV